MAIVNVLLGVGGTGAKIIESTLVLMSTGLGPQDKVYIGLIDQDNSNGNVVRADRLLNLLCKLRRGFGTSTNAIDWTSADANGGTPLLSVPLEPLFGDGGKAHWRPAPDNTPTLRDIMRHQDMLADEQALFDLLFRGDAANPQDEEQTMDLAEGYRGRAHVGAAALVSAVNHDQPEFRRRLVELMKMSNGGDEVRIFMAGSLFGGTGAAGFPTIARMLHKLRDPDNRHEQIKSDKVKLGGALMLPYFRFSDPNDATANVITAAQLLPQARVALEFYQSLLQQEGVFDRLYVSGWDEMFELGYHEPGRAEQKNPPLLPELVAALAAIDFFDPAQTIKAASVPLVAARRNGEGFGWADLPGTNETKERLYTRLGGALRFAVWWLYRVEPTIDKRGRFGGRDWPKWLAKLSDGVDWQNSTPEIRQDMKDYSQVLLDWASSMQLFSEPRIRSLSLWDTARIRSRSDITKPTDPLDLHLSREESETLDDLQAVLQPSDPNAPPVDARVVYSDLSTPLAVGKSRGLGKLVAGVHRATRPFRTGA